MIFKNKKVLGFYLIGIGFLALLNIILSLPVAYACIILTIFLSVHLIAKSFADKVKNGRLFITGSVILIVSMFSIIYDVFLKNTGYTFDKIWPLIPMMIGVSFILYKLCINPNNVGVYIPGIFIFFISVILFLYSFSILSDFKKFLLILIPCFIIYIGIYLITDNKFKE